MLILGRGYRLTSILLDLASRGDRIEWKKYLCCNMYRILPDIFCKSSSARDRLSNLLIVVPTADAAAV